MAIYFNLADTRAVEAVCEMLENGVEGRNVSINVRSESGKVIIEPHENEEE
jgi:hypothetical protein